MTMVEGVLSYNKLVGRTRRLVQRYGVPRHWSRTRNETFDVHTVCVLFVLFQVEQKDYRLFSGWLAITTALGLPSVPHWTTVHKAFRRLPPRLIRSLMRLAGQCQDRVVSLDPTYYQLTNPSQGYCRRIGRDARHDACRKVSVVVGTASHNVLDVVIRAPERHGLKDLPRLVTGGSFFHRTVVADKEFDAETFHQQIEDAGGRSITPLRKRGLVPYHRIQGRHRKALSQKPLSRLYSRRAASESNNSAVKRRFSPTLRGKSFSQHTRDVYGKYLAYKLTPDCFWLLSQNFLQSLVSPKV